MSVLLNQCGGLELDFFQLLAGALVIDGSGNIRLRVVVTEELCTAVSPLLDCDTKDVDPKELFKLAFSKDSCDRISLNLSTNAH
jgi:hypothetical protein